METIELVRVFVKVVQTGSFTKAGELLKQPKSTVSKSVARLEKETGTKLLLRTTRSLTLTAAGRAFYDTCVGPVQVLEDARKSLHGQDSILSGLVRITAPEDLGTYVISPAIAELTRRNPQLSFELNYSDELVDLVREGFDMAIRIGKLKESGLKARKVGEVTLVFVASPAYLKSVDKIRDPSDLRRIDSLTISARSMLWSLKSSKGETAQVKVEPRVISNQMTALMTLAMNHSGVALVPHYLCRDELEKGLLVRVLPDWSTPGSNVSILSPATTASSARLKVTTEHLGQAIEKELNKCRSGRKS